MNHIVLYHPEIPQNTGNIMRTCVAVNAKLHLIEPLGFSLDEKYVKRSAANYLEHLDYTLYPSLDAFFEQNQGSFYIFSRYGEKRPDELDLSDTQRDHYYLFGAESTGLPKDFLQTHLDWTFRLPMSDKVRSLNLSNCAAIVLYEAMRQQGYPSLFDHEPEIFKGKDYLKKL